jgi:hypothetical protein
MAVFFWGQKLRIERRGGTNEASTYADYFQSDAVRLDISTKKERKKK